MCYMFSKGVFFQRQEFYENKMSMSLLFTFVGHFRKTVETEKTASLVFESSVNWGHGVLH